LIFRKRMPPHEFIGVVRALVIIFDCELRITLAEPGIPFLLHLEQCGPAPAFNLSEIVATLQLSKLNAEAVLQIIFARQEQSVSPDFRIAANPLLLTRVTLLAGESASIDFSPKGFQPAWNQSLIEKGWFFSDHGPRSPIAIAATRQNASHHRVHNDNGIEVKAPFLTIEAAHATGSS
jgi:hypothetical protein